MSVLMEIAAKRATHVMVNPVWTPIYYKQMLFPDGQPHVTLSEDVQDKEVRIRCRLQHALDFIELLLLKDVLENQGVEAIDLDILYMSGARMDRRIDDRQPFTLWVYAKLVADAGFRHIRVLDPHSDVATALLGAEAYYPISQIAQLLRDPLFKNVVIVAPDAGATKRVATILQQIGAKPPVIQGLKHRDIATGKLSGFEVATQGISLGGKHCLIIDDICDGGGTFTGLSHVLKNLGASVVDLYVTHGIFSKGTSLEDINHIYTTDSLHNQTHPGLTILELDKT